jgi:hypothetical protein
MKLLVANPLYSPMAGPVSMGVQLSLQQRHPDWEIATIESCSTALTYNFNRAWCAALNMRATSGLTHFLMIHQDVRPRYPDFLDVMLDEMRQYGADILSAVIAIKSDQGLTSTAVDTDLWRPQRLTLAEVHGYPKPTWTAPKLLINTGLMLVDMCGDWVEKAFFTMTDKIERNRKNGQWEAFVAPEDWNFSRLARSLGAKIYATRAVAVDHFGVSHWPNDPSDSPR